MDIGSDTTDGLGLIKSLGKLFLTSKKPMSGGELLAYGGQKAGAVYDRDRGFK